MFVINLNSDDILEYFTTYLGFYDKSHYE